MTATAFPRPPIAMTTFLALMLSCGASPAQSPSDAPGGEGISEIVVTATRRQERLQDVPVSITAFTPEQMDAQGLRTIDDITRVTPGVTFQRMGMSLSANYNDENSDINFRGIDSQAGTSTTGIYIDDTPVQTRHIGFGSVNPFPSLFDLDRVEVLRGPQGTLFGAGAEGGVVRFISPEPSLTKDSGYLRAESSYTQDATMSYNVGAAAGGPIVDGVLGFRVSASFERDGGYVDRVSYTHPSDPADPTSVASIAPVYAATTEKDADWQETKTVRAALKWAINDVVSVTPSFFWQELQINDTAAYWVNLSDPSADVFRNGNALTNPSTDPFWLAAVKFEWNLGFAQLTSNTSYFSRDQHSVSDYTQYSRASFLGNSYPESPEDGGYTPFGDKQSNFYQEVRAASLDSSAPFVWNGGIFYSHLDENVPESVYDPTLNAEFAAANGGFPLCGAAGASVLGADCPNGAYVVAPINKSVDRQVALFGETSYKLTETLKATVGLRVARVDSTGTSLQTGGAFVTNPGVVTSVNSPIEKPVTPKFVLSWQPDRNNLYYLSASKGYRVGGINYPLGSTCAGDLAAIGIPLSADGTHHVPSQYSSDSLWSYEIGGKNSWFDHRLQVNSSLFLIDWNKIQQNVYLPDCGSQYVANMGKVQSRGGDIAIQFRPFEPLTLGLTVGYTDARFTETSCANGLDFDGTKCVGGGSGLSAAPIVSKGDRLVGAPWTVLTSAEFTHALALFRGNTGYLRLDYQVTTKQTDLLAFQDSRNALFDDTIPGLPQVNNLQLRAGVRWSGFDLSLFGNNLTNQHPLMFESRDIPPNLPTSLPDNLYFGRTTRPRTIGITATYRY